MSITPESNGAKVTSWIPLMTVYTPSQSCQNVFRLNGPSLVAFDAGYGYDIDTAVDCEPSAVTTWWEGIGVSGSTAVSIQPLTCPNEWTTVVTSVKDTSSTQIMCCPSGYYLANGVTGSVAGDCLSDVSKSAVLTYASTDSSDTTEWYTQTTTLTASSTVGAIAVVGWNVARAASSTKTSTTVTAISSLLSSVSSVARLYSLSSTTHATISTAGSSSQASAGMLSTGAKAGIGLGVSLGFIGIVALIVAMFMFRRRQREQRPDTAASATHTAPDTVPWGSYVYAQYPQRYWEYNPGQQHTIYELPDQVRELSNNPEPLELDHSYKIKR